MKKIAIIYGEYETALQKKSIEHLTQSILDYTIEYPVCKKYNPNENYEEYRCIYIGTKENNPFIKKASDKTLTKPEEYYIKVKDDVAFIEGYDDAGVLYGCLDFYNKYLLKFEITHDSNNYFNNVFKDTFPDFELNSAPSVKNRGIWTWGHVIYDYNSFIDNMLKLKMNTLIIWNDFVPVNAKEMIAYAHDCNIRVIWGYPWCWDVDCNQFDLKTIDSQTDGIIAKYEKEYLPLNVDGIYFQSFTELPKEDIDGVLIAEAVTNFVNKTSAKLYEKYPDIELQFGLHAMSVKEKLNYIEKVDPRIQIVWEDCGAFPYDYTPGKIADFDKTMDFTKKIAHLRGKDDNFGVVTKGFTKLDWGAFTHPVGQYYLGKSSEYLMDNRIHRKNNIWRYVQAYWLRNADKAYEMIKLMCDLKDGNLYITGLVEDGMFEKNIMYPVALYGEMLWDCNADVKDMMAAVALRNYITFA